MTVLISVILIIAGCGQQSGDFVIQKNTEYQYSAPWDKNLFEVMYKNKQNVKDVDDVKGAIVPHHLLSGYMPATLFDYFKKQDPSTIVIIGPNHFSRGYSNIITSDCDWKTPFGEVIANHGVINTICNLKSVTTEESVVKEEHSIYSLVSFVAKSLPDAKVVPIILSNNIKNDEMDKLVEVLNKELPKDAVIISSIDFSHYQTASVAEFHDELSKSVIKNFDYTRLSKLEIDSTPSLYVLLKLMEKFGAQKPVYEMYDNPGQTSHYSVWFGANPSVPAGHLPFVRGGQDLTPPVGGGVSAQGGRGGGSKTASILFFGDMMLDRNVARRIGEHGADWLFSTLAGEENRFLQGMDDIHVNLEGPFKENCPNRGSMTFCFNPNSIPTLKKYNFSIFGLANNHTLNMGKKGFDETRDYLDKYELSHYGDNYGVGVLNKEIGGIKIAFLNFNEVGNKINEEGLVLTIQTAKTENDFVIVTPHWGEEYQYLKSNKHQQYLAHKIIDAGADAIIGTHPHVVQEMEIYKDKPIFYSLGNFIFDQYFSPETQVGLGVGLVLKDGGQQSIYVFPLQSTQSQVKLMSGSALDTFFTQLTAKSHLDNNKFDNFNLKL